MSIKKINYLNDLISDSTRKPPRYLLVNLAAATPTHLPPPQYVTPLHNRHHIIIM
jgi:hypothetical protein